MLKSNFGALILSLCVWLSVCAQSDLENSSHEMIYVGNEQALVSFEESTRTEHQFIFFERSNICFQELVDLGSLSISGEVVSVFQLSTDFSISCKRNCKLLFVATDGSLLGYYPTCELFAAIKLEDQEKLVFVTEGDALYTFDFSKNIPETLSIDQISIEFEKVVN